MSSTRSKPLLIVEDDLALQKQLRWAFDDYETVTASDRESAIAQIRRYQPPVVTMDLGLPPEPDTTSEGFRLLEEILSIAPDTKVIVLTGQNDRENALKAVALGAYDFFAKPFEVEMLSLIVSRAFTVFELQLENKRLQLMQHPDSFSGLISRDPTMLKTCRTAERVASSNATVMILGESGTGKELIARGLHASSDRKEGRFVAINCAAIPDNLLESELFGYEKGAFTGAGKTTLGKIETANGGTLMLDEIGDLPHALQAKLLRFLQERVVERIGGRQEIPVDVRIVCATHQNLETLISDGKFREDLYYRLAEIVITIPPLRDRAGDCALLAYAFMRRFAEEQRRGVMTFREDALRAIENYRWPGNVRQLENCVKRAVIMAEGNHISAEDLALPETPTTANPDFDLRLARESAEQRVIISALSRSDGNILKAAELLGVSRPTLYDLMHRLGIR